MIPDFPNFKKIELSDAEAINEYALKFGGYSDFIFSNLWSWDLEDKCEISLLNNNLVIHFTDYYEKSDFFSFLGDNKVKKTVETLLNHEGNQDIRKELGFMTEEIIKPFLSHPEFKITPLKENFDYIYSVEKMSTYTGLKYKNKRGLTNKFCKEYPNAKIQTKNLDDSSVQFELRKIFQLSKSSKNNRDCGYYLGLEAKSFEKILKINKELNLLLTCTYIDNKMAGFSLDEILPNNTALSHFFKVDYNFVGIYEFQNMYIAKYLLENGIDEWNWVEDLGIENLRKSKLSYRPKKLLKTYKISMI